MRELVRLTVQSTETGECYHDCEDRAPNGTEDCASEVKGDGITESHGILTDNTIEK